MVTGVFKNFEKEGKFFAFYGQSTQAVSGMYNLFRASQLQYPGETILEKARLFSFKYLKEKQLSNQLLDKWSIAKDLQGEVYIYILLHAKLYYKLFSNETVLR